jgi:hypothetical protein
VVSTQSTTRYRLQVFFFFFFFKTGKIKISIETYLAHSPYLHYTSPNSAGKKYQTTK